VIDDDMLSPACPKSVIAAAAIYHTFLALVFVAHAKAHVTHDYIVARNGDRLVCYANAIAGGRLAGNGSVGLYTKGFFQMNGARHGKYNHPRPFGFGCFAQAAGAVVVKVCDGVHLAATATGSVFAITFGTGKCGCGTAGHRGANTLGYAPIQQQSRRQGANCTYNDNVHDAVFLIAQGCSRVLRPFGNGRNPVLIVHHPLAKSVLSTPGFAAGFYWL
jgi:hypothetical protein